MVMSLAGSGGKLSDLRVGEEALSEKRVGQRGSREDETIVRPKRKTRGRKEEMRVGVSIGGL
jgi:hypothetical protein